jgi:acyl dehydratase
MGITVNGLDELKKPAGSDPRTSDWIDITQERINTFADATGDHQWIHVDVKKAKDGPFGAPIAHGCFSSRSSPSCSTSTVSPPRFPSPVRVGSRIRLVARLADVEEVPGGVQVTADGTIEIEGGAKPAAVLQSVSRF